MARQFVITYWVVESAMREVAGGLPRWPGAHAVLVNADSLADAVNLASPQDDCYRVEVAEIVRDNTKGGEQ